MFKKGLTVLLMALLAAPLFADVSLSTSIADVYHLGSNELAGSITMRVTADDFADATTDEPIFIRVTLDHQATLADTLVDLINGDTRTDSEIYLAMSYSGPGGFHLAAAPTAVSIVRWVAGESALWIRVQQATDLWIGTLDLGNPASVTTNPFDTLTVAWTFGVSARSSHNFHSNIDSSLRNLPFNTRDDSLVRIVDGDGVDDAVSTLICANLEDGNLQSLSTSGDESRLQFDPIAFDETAEVTEGSYRPGGDTGINFTNDFMIARGKDRNCAVTWDSETKSEAPAVPLCVDDPGENGTVDGWVCDTNRIIYTITCNRGGDFLDTDMYDGAYINFSTVANSYGFRYSSDASDPNGDSSGYRSVTEGTFNNTIDLVWTDGFAAINPSLTWTADLKVWRWYTDGAVDVDINWAMRLVNHSGSGDDQGDGFDVDNPDHNLRCAQSEYLVGSDTWNWGSFIECAGTPSVIFFPYLPTIQGNDSFWAGLAIVNHGEVDFDALDVRVYAENGDRYNAEFPALGQKEQYTWLLQQNDAGQVGFAGYSASNDGDFIVPTPNGDEDPEAFGATRSSMFVTGNFDATYNQEKNDGDLDGYLLVGKGGDIDGSYLPRNTETSTEGKDGFHQDGDLPPTAKRGVAPKVELYKTQPATYGRK